MAHTGTCEAKIKQKRQRRKANQLSFGKSRKANTQQPDNSKLGTKSDQQKRGRSGKVCSNQRNTRSKSLETKAKAKKSIEQAKKVLSKNVRNTKSQTENVGSKKKGQVTKSNGTSRSKSKTKRGKNSQPEKRSVKKTLQKMKRKQRKENERNRAPSGEKESEEQAKPKTLFDVFDEVLGKDSNISLSMMSFLHPADTTPMTSSLLPSIVTSGDANSLFRPCLHRGNSIIKEN